MTGLEVVVLDGIGNEVANCFRVGEAGLMTDGVTAGVMGVSSFLGDS